MDFKKWVKIIQTAGYNVARTVVKFFLGIWISQEILEYKILRYWDVWQTCYSAVMGEVDYWWSGPDKSRFIQFSLLSRPQTFEKISS